MSKKTVRRLVACLALVQVFGIYGVESRDVSAVFDGGIVSNIDESTNGGPALNGIMEKAILQGVYRCYTEGKVKDQINPLSDYGGGTKPLSVMLNSIDNNDQDEWFIPYISAWKSTDYTTRDGLLTCDYLFNGGDFSPEFFTFLHGKVFGIQYESVKGLLEVFNKDIPSKTEPEKVVRLFGREGMGYYIYPNSESGAGEKCFQLNYSYETTNELRHGSTNAVCLSEDGRLSASGIDNGYGHYLPFFTVSSNNICLKYKIPVTTYPGFQERLWGECSDNVPNYASFGGEWLLEFATNTACPGNECKYRISGKDLAVSFDDSKGNENNDSLNLDHLKASFTPLTPVESESGDYGVYAAQKAISYLSDSKYTTVPLIKNEDLDKRRLYQAYLLDFYKLEIDCSGGKSEAIFEGAINWYSDDAIRLCRYNKESAKNIDERVNGLNSNGFFEFNTLGLDELIAAVGNLPTDYPSDGVYFTEGTTDIIEDDKQNNAEVTCMSSSAAGSLSWILCPVLDLLSGASEKLFQLVEPLLQIEPQLFTGDGNEVRSVWGIFRDIANVVFVIVLLVVVFSQITGMGVDNYGIKKVLPRLVVAAILINISYFLCTVFVDISNMVGNGIQRVFDGVGLGGVSKTIDGVEIDGLKYGSAALAGGILSLAVASTAFLANPAIVLSLLVSALGVVASAFTLFIILSLREAMVVVCVVLSPLALVCYMLPNMKKLFDKWIGIGKAVLLVYPICGLLVAGGNAVSRLLLLVTAEDAMGLIVAMLVGVVPIFFIPTVLKNALNSVDGIGAKISGIGDRFGGAIKRGTSDSGIYKHAQENLERVGHRFNSGIRRDGSEAQMGRFQTFMRGGRRRVAKNRSEYLSDLTKLRNENRLMGEGFNAAIAGLEAKTVDEEYANRLELMRNPNAIGGGIRLNKVDANEKPIDGQFEEKPVAFTYDNALKRLNQLKDLSGKEGGLNSSERVELGGLLRGFAAMPGSGGKIGELVRTATTNGAHSDSVNANFMSAFGEAYSRDATLRKTLDAKDAGASIFTEQFLSGGNNANGQSFNAYRQTEEYKRAFNNRVKSYEAGLNQGGMAFDEYLNMLRGIEPDDEKRRMFQQIIDNNEFMEELENNDARNKIYQAAYEAGARNEKVRRLYGENNQ